MEKVKPKNKKEEYEVEDDVYLLITAINELTRAINYGNMKNGR